MKKEYIGLLLVLGLILLVVVSFIIYNEFPFINGKKIILATRPVDPFDPFKGQYMTINYDISRLNDVQGFNSGETIYVLLKENNTGKSGIWIKEDVSKTRPSSGDFIKGKVKSMDGNNIVVEYGISQYYFERNADIPTRNITVEVILASSGRGKISQLLYNGMPVDIKYKAFDIRS